MTLRARIARAFEEAGAAVAFLGLALAVTADRIRGPVPPPLIVACNRCGHVEPGRALGLRCATGDAASDRHGALCRDSRCQWPADPCIGGTCEGIPCAGVYRPHSPRTPDAFPF